MFTLAYYFSQTLQSVNFQAKVRGSCYLYDSPVSKPLIVLLVSIIIGLPITYVLIDAQCVQILQVSLPLFIDTFNDCASLELIQIVIVFNQKHVAFGFFLTRYG